MSLPDLVLDDFPAFFKAVQGWDPEDGWTGRGHDPFPWQARLVREIAEHRHWPDLLDLPTGSGKTAAIDIAVYHLALEADRGEVRCAPMRIVFVVDRRLVVDDAYNRAKKLAVALDTASNDGG